MRETCLFKKMRSPDYRPVGKGSGISTVKIESNPKTIHIHPGTLKYPHFILHVIYLVLNHGGRIALIPLSGC